MSDSVLSTPLTSTACKYASASFTWLVNISVELLFLWKYFCGNNLLSISRRKSSGVKVITVTIGYIFKGEFLNKVLRILTTSLWQSLKPATKL